MTRDDILKLDGDALNARVAIDVMGEEKPVYSHNHVNITEPVFSEKGNWYCLPEWSKGDLCEWKPKRFCDDILAAWQIDRPGWVWDFSESDLGLYVTLKTPANNVEVQVTWDYVTVTTPTKNVDLQVTWDEVENDKSRAYCLGRCRTALLAVLDVPV